MRTIDVHGSGSRSIGKIDIEGGIGSVEIECETVPLAIYRGFDGEEHRVLRALAIKGTAIYPLRLYCTYDGELDYVYYSGTDQLSYDGESIEGRCGVGDGTAERRLRFPSLDLQVPARRTGVTVDGPSINLSADGTGTVVVDGASREFHVFEHGFCGSCADNGEPVWHDLHALLWESEAQRLTYVVASFDEGDADVVLSQGVVLPGLSNDESTWTTLPATVTVE